MHISSAVAGDEECSHNSGPFSLRRLVGLRGRMEGRRDGASASTFWLHFPPHDDCGYEEIGSVTFPSTREETLSPCLRHRKGRKSPEEFAEKTITMQNLRRDLLNCAVFGLNRGKITKAEGWQSLGFIKNFSFYHDRRKYISAFSRQPGVMKFK